MLCAQFMAYSKPWRSVAEQLAQVQAVGVRIGEPAVVCNMLELRAAADASHPMS